MRPNSGPTATADITCRWPRSTPTSKGRGRAVTAWFRNVPDRLERFPWLYSLDTRLNVFNSAVISLKDGISFVSDTFNACLGDCPVLDGESQTERTLRQTSYLSIMFFMHSFLERKDRMSMASALEVRALRRPQDRRVCVQHSVGIKRRNDVEKAVLRDALTGVLPERITRRMKSPYPKTHSPRHEQIVMAVLRERLEDKCSILRDLLRRDFFQDLDKAKSVTWFGQLMAKPQLIAYLIQLDHWFCLYEVEMV